MFVQLLLCFLFILSTTSASQERSIRVNLTTGPIEGHRRFYDGVAAGQVFLGVPYAEAPVGPLRFSEAKRKLPWTNGTLPCHKYKAACWQNRSMRTRQNWISEDCLYVNVFAGENCTFQQSLCAVIVYIHGGAFDFDSPTTFSPRDILQNFSSRSVIFVTVGYRLNVLGFFSTGTPEAPGNNGLSDIIQALEWVQREIAAFGGDPSKVTLMGHSSGATAVSLLTLSPRTNNLISRAIVMSGSALTPDSIMQSDVNYKLLAFRLGCTSSIMSFGNNVSQVLECLRKVPVDVLDSQYTNIESELDSYTAPKIDGIGGILPEHPLKLMVYRFPMNYMIGTSKNEFVTGGTSPVGRDKPATPLNLLLACKAALVSSKLKEGKIKENVKECFVHYATKAVMNANSTTGAFDWAGAVEQLKNDYGIFWPVFLDASFMKNAGAPVYLYSFDYQHDERDESSPWHSMDLAYVLGLHAFPFKEQDRQVQENWLTLLTNFAKFGNPTPQAVDSVLWSPFQYPTNYNYMSVDKQLAMKPFYHLETITFIQTTNDDGIANAHEEAPAKTEDLDAKLMRLYENLHVLTGEGGSGANGTLSTDGDRTAVILYWTCIGLLLFFLIVGIIILICCGRAKHKQAKIRAVYAPLGEPKEKCLNQTFPMYQTF